MLFYKPWNRWIFIVILAFFEDLKGIDNVFTSDIWFIASTNDKLSTLIVKVEGDTQSLIGINGRLLGEDSGIVIREVDLDTGEVDEASELILLVGNLTTLNSGLLYRLLSNNGLEMTLLLIHRLMTASTYFLVSLNSTSFK